MLYRNPEVPLRLPLSYRIGRLAAALSAVFATPARRRRADLDLMALSPHLKRDLGLEDFRRRGR